jgi:hypothetical protein
LERSLAANTLVRIIISVIVLYSYPPSSFSTNTPMDVSFIVLLSLVAVVFDGCSMSSCFCRMVAIFD